METVDGLATVVEQLTTRVRELEQRVAALEGAPATASAAEVVVAAVEVPVEQSAKQEPELLIPPLLRPMPPRVRQEGVAGETPAGVFTTVGKAVLGMAGAYLLRAVAESGSVPKVAVVAVAIVYAAAWMVWSARVYAKSHFASVVYAVTSAMILTPMLWETTVRFQALAPAVTGAVLVGYVVLTLVLAREHDLELAPWVATIAASVAGIGLILTTHALVPLVVALLLVALASEVSSCTGHRLTQRVLAALAADVAVWLLIDIAVLSKTVPEGYAPVSVGTATALCLALLAIYGGSIGVRGYLQLGTITYFDVGQGVVAFALATFGAVEATKGSIDPVLGAAYLALAAMSYWGALSRFAPEELARNRRVSATWAAALLVAGIWLLPAGLLVVFLGAAAVVAAFLYAKTAEFSLGIHVSVYLLAAAVLSPVLGYMISALAGGELAKLSWSAWVVGLAAAMSYIVGARHPEEQVRRRVLWVVPALLAGFAVAALAVSAIVGVAGGSAGLGASRLSMVRTIVGCAVALGLAFVGSRWNRVELGWVAYAAIGFGTLKLLLEDLRFGNPASLVVSLLFYGGVLILLPKMMQRGKAEA
jgi:hypothetical protein